eukprot:CAMPEP_0206227288 /NCGR_PEP_ID=MMETSP0047_2-20121206/8544_1 /ASSEMBLY_ACC=CAM_ASM_000192 /TAXON_ID=195065 /ORGANISM="Chroomonas mesostigmatica_cf, Strain CCMP1168" /LENGTH=290 /DNA_ID=CAMNT_0053650431 /DNA_START=15 /DNA_END=888 /DNA_ORIENTATION=-
MLRSLAVLAMVGLSAAFSPAALPLAPRHRISGFSPSTLPVAPLRPTRCVAGGLRMAPVSSNDFRPGVTIKIDGNVYKIVEHLHVKPGKGSAFVRTKLKNLTTGGSVERTFRAGETVDGADVFRTDLQFNYLDGDNYVFMDMETFETKEVPGSVIGDNKIWMKEGVDVKIVTEGDKILDIEIPLTMTLEVTETDPGVKGNTAQGGTKPAKLETGAEVNVPLFIQQGELIRVDTVERKYLSRAKDDSKKFVAKRGLFGISGLFLALHPAGRAHQGLNTVGSECLRLAKNDAK